LRSVNPSTLTNFLSTITRFSANQKYMRVRLLLAVGILFLSTILPSAGWSVQRLTSHDGASWILKLVDGADAPRIVIPKRHPRLYLLAADLVQLREKRHDPMFALEWANIEFGQVEPIANALHALIEPGAFDPATKLDKCELAIRQSLQQLERTVSDERNVEFLFLKNFHRAAIVYDWCYGAMSGEQRFLFIRNFKRLAAIPGSPGYPAPRNSPSLVGHEAHGSILGNQLAAGLAIYDEDPTMFDAAATVALGQYRRASEFLFPGITDLQGIYYARHDHFITANWLFRSLGLPNAFSPALAQMPYEWIYALRSDGRMLRSGDLVDDNNRSKMYRYTFSAVGSYYGDPLLAWMGESDNRDRPLSEWRATHWAQFHPLTPDMYALRFIFLSRALRKQALLEGQSRLERLPLALYAPSPSGRLLFRTGWSSVTEGIGSRDAVIDMKIGEYFTGNHQRKDFGTFQIYFRGPLAISAGVYQGAPNSWYGAEHWVNYYHQTASTNGLLIFDENEKQFLYGERANDGGQIWPNHGADHPKSVEEVIDPNNGYHMARAVAHAIGSGQRYAYLAGDLTAAYSSSKVSSVQRSMVAIRLDQEQYPAMFVVGDYVKSKRPQMEKRFLLHSVERPQIEGRTITIENLRSTYNRPSPRGKYSGNYGGKLILQSLFPENADIRLVQGNLAGDRYYQSTKPEANGEEGWGRIEIAASGSEESNFLSVMLVTDATNQDVPTTHKVSTADLIGCETLGKTVLLAKGSLVLGHATSFSISGTWLFIGGIAPGEWELIQDDKVVKRLSILADSNSAQLEDLSPGSFVLRPVKLEPAK
jgi:hypothetical protein